MSDALALPAGPVIVGLAGTALSPTERMLLQHPAVGGVILFDRNLRDAAQLRALTAQIRALREPRLLVSVDQEGGRVQRLRGICPLLPDAAALGALYDADPAHALRCAYALGQVLAAQCIPLGIDLSYAPVLDLDHGVSAVIGARALHAQAAAVAALARAQVAGMAAGGMAAVGKHFPGHGAVAPDTHHALALDERPRAQLETDLAPYRALGNQLAGVMLAHVIYPAVDEVAAGYSRRWCGEVLRADMGFDGAAISDDLGMAGGAGPGDLVARAQTAVDAGCDYVLLCNELDGAPAVLAALRWSSTPEHARRHRRLLAATATPPAVPEAWSVLAQAGLVAA